ncbi:MAG: Uma2 family endonuclease [Archangium sp.]|nr:Uma2 family endonuclease [Archangium sp.]
MREVRRKPATYADLENLPPNMTGQIIDGELWALPRPSVAHAQASSALGADLQTKFGRNGPPGGWWILSEPELHLRADVLVPDLAGWRRATLPALPNENFLSIAPDWVLEVLSPSTASIDRVAKARIYAREKVSFLWFVDPEARTLEVLRLEGGKWLQLGAWPAGEKVRAEPFDAVEFDTAEWFLIP